MEGTVRTGAGRVGAGNIAGVSVAIMLGGPGAIFWMWITALFGMALAFAMYSISAEAQAIYALDAILMGVSVAAVSAVAPVFIVGADITEFTSLFGASKEEIKPFTGISAKSGSPR